MKKMKKIKMGIIGAGVWGEYHAAVYSEHPGAELAAICDLDAGKAMRVASRFNIGEKAVFDDYKDMLRHADIDAVAIATPDFLHRDAAIDCAGAGKHMLIEKPLATARKDVYDIVKAVERNKVRVMVDFHNRWNPPFAVMKKAIGDGEIGEPWCAYFRLNDKQMVATDMLSWAARSSILWFLGSHSVDTLRWIFNDEVKRVFSVSRSGILKNKGVDCADVYQTILEFERGGIATMENGWITPDSHPCINDIRFNVTGTKGMFNLDLSNSSMIERYTESGMDHPDVLVRHYVHNKAQGFAFESIRHFIDRLLDGKDFLVSLGDAVNTSLVLLAIMDSAMTGQPADVIYSAM